MNPIIAHAFHDELEKLSAQSWEAMPTVTTAGQLPGKIGTREFHEPVSREDRRAAKKVRRQEKVQAYLEKSAPRFARIRERTRERLQRREGTPAQSTQLAETPTVQSLQAQYGGSQ